MNPRHGLPPVFPVVLYNGDTRWRIATNVRELIDCPSVLNAYQPGLRYFLLDEGAYSLAELTAKRNAVAASFSIIAKHKPIV